MGTLMFLDISQNNLGDIGVQELGEALRGTISIKKLNLIDCKFGPSGAEQLFHNMSFNCSITDLKVDRNKFRIRSDDPAAECTVSALTCFLEVNACLKSLSMSHCDLGTSGMSLINKGLESNKSLVSLNLQKNEISDRAMCSL